MLSSLFHVSVTGYYLWLNCQSYYVVTELYSKRTDIYSSLTGGGLELFTVWNQIIQQSYFYVCFALDIIDYATNGRYHKLKSVLATVKLYMYPCFVLPSALMVVINFWSIYSIAPELMEGTDVMGLHIPSWYNHCIHTHVGPLALLELVVSSRVYPRKAVGFVAIPMLLVAYCVVLFCCHYIGNTWPYPMFALMNNGHRLAYFLGNCGLGLTAYLLGDVVNTAMWGNQTNETESNGCHRSTKQQLQNGYQLKKVR